MTFSSISAIIRIFVADKQFLIDVHLTAYIYISFIKTLEKITILFEPRPEQKQKNKHFLSIYLDQQYNILYENVK